MSIDKLIAELRRIDAHVVVSRRAGGHAVDHRAAGLVATALAGGAFDGATFNNFRAGSSALASLAEWLQRNGYQVFDGNGPQAERIAAAIESVAGGYAANETELVLGPSDTRILEYLAHANRTVTQYDLDAARIVSRRTAGPRLKNLRKAGLTCRPHGPRGGEAITLAGRKRIALSLRPDCPQTPRKNERML